MTGSRCGPDGAAADRVAVGGITPDMAAERTVTDMTAADRAAADRARVFWLRGSVLKNGAVAGRLHRFCSGENAAFHGLDMAVLIMNGWLEGCRFAPPGTALRVFGDPGKRSRTVEPEGAGSIAPESRREELLICVIDRKHTSLQGEIRWRGCRAYFRSALELTSLIRSALEGEDSVAP